MPARPPASVRSAFRVNGVALKRVAGGQGTSWRGGGIALKPWDEPEEGRWRGSVLAGIEEDGFRVARPVRAADGRYVVDGWCAYGWQAGSPRLRGCWKEAIAAIRAFHRALRDVRRPALFDRRKNPFAVADRIAWGEVPLKRVGSLGPDGDRLLRRLRPVRARSQLIQGDPSEGNLLFARDGPPAIIDMAP